MNEPLLHKRTLSALKNYLDKPTHGLIISGAKGSGRFFTSNWLASELEVQVLSIEPDPEKKQISIEQIRDLYSLTRTGTPLVVILSDADTMSQAAQNAFLKLLEEPPKNTYFIMTVSSHEKLLGTIKSRAQNIEISNLDKSDLLSELAAQYPDVSINEIESLIITSDYNIGSIVKLLNSREELEAFRLQIAQYKTFYSSSKFDRHVLCIENNFEKEWLQGLLKTLSIIVESLLRQQSASSETVKRLALQAEVIQATSQSLFKYPGNPKIHISKLIEYL